jgi:hypothetical protein
VDELIQKFFDAGIRINSRSKTKVTIDNRVFDPLDFYEMFLKEVPFFKEHVLANDIWQWKDKDKAQWVINLWACYFQEMRKRQASSSDAFEGSSINLGDFELVTNFHTGDKIVYNSKIRVISKMHPNALLSSMGKTQRQIMTESGVRLATFSFDPYNDFERRVIKLEGQEVVEFNCFHAPAWRCQDGSTIVDIGLEEKYKEVPAPKEFIEFMTHLFPIKDQRDYVYRWMYNSIFSRNEVYLCLNGKKGSGKNAFVQLLSHLVGRDYFKDINRRVFDEGFNAVLDKARLIQFDEIKADNDHKVDILKKYINRDQNIEKKGVDADALTETFNSFIINNNDITDLKLEWDDRRFSVPDIATKRLKDIWSQDKIDDFHNMFTDIEFQRRVGFFIRRQVGASKVDVFAYLTGKRFWEIVYNSLPEWQRVIVDHAVDKTSLTLNLTELRLNYKRTHEGSKIMFPIRNQKVKDFMEDYRHLGTHQIGEVRGYSDDVEIAFFEGFRPEAAVDSSSPLDAALGFQLPEKPSEPRAFKSVL